MKKSKEKQNEEYEVTSVLVNEACVFHLLKNPKKQVEDRVEQSKEIKKEAKKVVA